MLEFPQKFQHPLSSFPSQKILFPDIHSARDRAVFVLPAEIRFLTGLRRLSVSSSKLLSMSVEVLKLDSLYKLNISSLRLYWSMQMSTSLLGYKFTTSNNEELVSWLSEQELYIR